MSNHRIFPFAEHDYVEITKPIDFKHVGDRQHLLKELRKLETVDLGTMETHEEADRLLLHYVGDQDIAQAFDDLYKWYA